MDPQIAGMAQQQQQQVDYSVSEAEDFEYYCFMRQDEDELKLRKMIGASIEPDSHLRRVIKRLRAKHGCRSSSVNKQVPNRGLRSGLSSEDFEYYCFMRPDEDELKLRKMIGASIEPDSHLRRVIKRLRAKYEHGGSSVN